MYNEAIAREKAGQTGPTREELMKAEEVKARHYHREVMASPDTYGPPSIGAQLDELGCSVSTLFDAVDRLESRLEPVCLPQPPFGTAEGSAPAPLRSPIAEQIAGKTNDIRILGMRLSLLTERLNL